MFTIEIASLRPGIHHFEFEPEPEEVDLDKDMFSPVRVNARLDVEGDRLLVLLNVAATAKLQCDRTLEKFDQEVGDSFDVLFAPPDFVEYQVDAFDEVRVLNPSDLEIDLTDVVRDTILLSLPQRRVAPGAEEAEIQTEFGAPEDDVDPRWEALRKLRSGASR